MSATDEAQRWFRQADADLAAARAVQETHPYVACFLAQQAAEKALKGAQLRLAGVTARTHLLSRIKAMLHDLGCLVDEIEQKAVANLDRMYTEARYPDVLPDTTPAEYFTPEHAAEAIRQAETIVGAAKRLRRREPRQQSRDWYADRER